MRQKTQRKGLGISDENSSQGKQSDRGCTTASPLKLSALNSENSSSSSAKGAQIKRGKQLFGDSTLANTNIARHQSQTSEKVGEKDSDRVCKADTEETQKPVKDEFINDESTVKKTQVGELGRLAESISDTIEVTNETAGPKTDEVSNVPKNNGISEELVE